MSIGPSGDWEIAQNSQSDRKMRAGADDEHIRTVNDVDSSAVADWEDTAVGLGVASGFGVFGVGG